MGTRYSKKTKEAVLRLGASGLTYSQIQKQFPIPKSTLSVWFNSEGRIPDRTRQLEHLKRARLKGIATIKQKRLDRIALATDLAQKELKKMDLKDKSFCKAMLAMLYWAEGTKSDKASLVFVNTDPALMDLYVSLLRKSYKLDETKFRVRLHVHDYHVQEEALVFWSEHLKIPRSQFAKIYVKKRSTQKKFRENFQGICFVYYGEHAIRRELMSLALQIADKQ